MCITNANEVDVTGATTVLGLSIQTATLNASALVTALTGLLSLNSATVEGSTKLTAAHGSTVSLLSITLANGVTLLNDGTATLENSATLEGVSTLENAGTLALGDGAGLSYDGTSGQPAERLGWVDQLCGWQ